MLHISKLITFFVQGLVIGAGPCLLICAPILLPFIAGTKRTWQEGFKAALVFGLARLAVYTLLGGAVGYIGYYLFEIFHSRIWGTMLWGGAGIFIIGLGILVILGREAGNPFCRSLQKQKIGSNTQSLILLGIIIGLSPCLPLVGVLTEIMFLSEKFYQGFLYGFAFGVGTVISPLLLLGALAPLIPAKLLRFEKTFNFICGALLIAVGVYMLYCAKWI
ncbi:MAG: sulfite exporter TauE/SafE family protein [Candidatus Margulisiibacteriota bacterium]